MHGDETRDYDFAVVGSGFGGPMLSVNLGVNPALAERAMGRIHAKDA